ncbi:uncharacterized protein LOC26526262 [Drosophila erecta]|uniref:Uncharacterized protein n=1 Tax=Drosophila erecta TaxID=7220 RepID=A0A0Q5U6H4_DROER|nr:uncharacterized protein LOC26526262 [Drosophila erecta]KQS44462.1 uncharacterized protein Dere_GG26438 [Drosophila erecta]
MNFRSLIVTLLNWLVWSEQVQLLNGIGIKNLDRTWDSFKAVQIPKQFYDAIEKSDFSKQSLQNKLEHFLEKLQKNLTLSAVLSNSEDIVTNERNYLYRMQELSTFFYEASSSFEHFSSDIKIFYETSKNASYALLFKLRQVPTGQPSIVKVLLTNYFAEMEFFHVLFSEIIDEAMEYSTESLRSIQKLFVYYADTQNIILENWKLKTNPQCCKLYINFLQHQSSQIFKCAALDNLNIVYDVYSVTKLNIKYIMRQLEFRIQRLFNCLLYKSLTLQCKLLKSAEQDLRILFSNLAELDMFLDIKTKKGRALALRYRREKTWINNQINFEPKPDDCLPIGFPNTQMSTDLKECFYFLDNVVQQ